MKSYTLQLLPPEVATLYWAMYRVRTEQAPIMSESPKDIDLLAFHLGIEQKLEELLEKIKAENNG